MKKLIFIILLLLIGCDGNRFAYLDVKNTRGDIKNIEVSVGKTQKSTIINLLGEPKNYRNNQKSSYITYNFDAVNYFNLIIIEDSFRQTFFMGDTNKRCITLYFDEKDILTSISID